jgi:succinate-semialdehyde dehydrogenase/glutarate-semialdehyde dehydrogenase
MKSKYRNTGQTWVCANRLLVQDDIYDDFARKLVAAVGKMKIGDGLVGDTDLGPLINCKAVETVEHYIADALAKGAKILSGGKRHPLGGWFFELTVLSGVTPETKSHMAWRTMNRGVAERN